jgi:hypothetical protein
VIIFVSVPLFFQSEDLSNAGNERLPEEEFIHRVIIQISAADRLSHYSDCDVADIRQPGNGW